MKTATLTLGLLLLCPLWPALGQQSSKQSNQPLNNESIVKLVKAGFSGDTIINIVNTQPGDYALGAEDIISLKQAGVSPRLWQGL